MRSYVRTLKRWSLQRRQPFLCEAKTEFLYTDYVNKLLSVLCHGMILCEGRAEAKKKKGAQPRAHATVGRICSVWRTSWVDTAERQEQNATLHKQVAAFRLGKYMPDLLSEKETTKERGRGVAREYYSSPSYDNHVVSSILVICDA
jgi:hypothetical protein